MKFYIFSDSKDTISLTEKGIKESFTPEGEGKESKIEIQSYEPIKQPTVAMFIPTWEKLVISKLVEAAQVPFLFVDPKVEDQTTLYLLLGIVLGMREPRSLDGMLNFISDDFEALTAKIIEANPIVPDRVATLDKLIFKESDEEIEYFLDNVYLDYPAVKDFSILKVFENNTFNEVYIDLDKINPALLVFIGYCFVRNIKLVFTGTKDHYLLRKLGTYTKNN